jgi:hypothetical protein
MDSVALFSWIAWLCTNGFSGSIFMDWVAPPPWNIHYTETNNKDMMIKILIDIKSFNDKDLTLKSSTLFVDSSN